MKTISSSKDEKKEPIVNELPSHSMVYFVDYCNRQQKNVTYSFDCNCWIGGGNNRYQTYAWTSIYKQRYSFFGFSNQFVSRYFLYHKVWDVNLQILSESEKKTFNEKN